MTSRKERKREKTPRPQIIESSIPEDDLRRVVGELIKEIVPQESFLKKNWIAILSVIVSGASALFAYLNVVASSEQYYDANSKSLRPEVWIVNDSTSIDREPISKEFYSNFDRYKFLAEINRKQNNSQNVSINPYWYFTPETNVKVRVNLVLKNISDEAKADIVFYCYASAGKDTTVRMLLDKFLGDSLSAYSDSTSTYENPLVLSTGQTVSVDGEITAMFEDSICAFHYLIVYKNELECYYYTYVVAKYRFIIYFPLLNRPLPLIDPKFTIDDIVTYTKDIDVNYEMIGKPYYLSDRFSYDEAKLIEKMRQSK